MPEIQAFRGIRYDLGHVGSLSDVIAPPYDVISPELQKGLYERHPCNVVRLELNRIEPGDDETDNRYIRAGRLLKNWRSEGVLFQESDPAIYVCQQQFTLGGRPYLRRGFVARVRLSPFGAGQVFPHEYTMSKPKLVRLMLTAVCMANLCPVFALYSDPKEETYRTLEAAIAGQTPLEATDHLGVVHRLWPVTDVATISAVAAQMGPRPLFIADGHHRYETACKYQEQIYDSGFLRPDHPANYAMVTLVAMEDPGLVVLPTHRLFRNIPATTAEQLAARLGDCFTVEPAGEGPDRAAAVWEDIEITGEQGRLALYTREDRRWTIAEITEAGRTRLAEVAADQTGQWRQLGVSILHRLLLETLLDCPPSEEIKYVHRVEEVAEELGSSEFPLAALVMPATVEHVRTMSLQGHRLPIKTTYFYPKLPAGLVINPLE
jgi:uncharacterized protein (DUF1015 family)